MRAIMKFLQPQERQRPVSSLRCYRHAASPLQNSDFARVKLRTVLHVLRVGIGTVRISRNQHGVPDIWAVHPAWRLGGTEPDNAMRRKDVEHEIRLA